MNLVELKTKIDIFYEIADNPELIEIIVKKIINTKENIWLRERM